MIRKKYKKSEINLNKQKKPRSWHQQIADSLPLHLFEDRFLVSAIVSAIFFFGMILLQSAQLSEALRQQQEAKKEKDTVFHEYSFWQQVVKSRPDYRDGYIMLSLITTQLGDKSKNSIYVQEAKKIDPNFEQTKQLEAMLGEK